MIPRYSLLSGMALTAILGLGSACGAPQGPFTAGAARATISGVVTATGGAPIAGAAIQITCRGGGPPSSVSSDSTGHYIANLETGSDPFDGNSGHLHCHFSEPGYRTSAG
jgi:hypothetical protein